MSNVSGDSVWASARRAWAERRAYTYGSLERGDMQRTLGISLAQASSDIQQLLAEHPGCLTYDLPGKCYRWTPGREPRLPMPDFVQAFAALDAPRPERKGKPVRC